MTAEDFVMKYFTFVDDHRKAVLTRDEVKEVLTSQEARDQSLKAMHMQRIIRSHMGLKSGEDLPQRKVKGKVVRVYTGIRYAKPRVEREAVSILDSFGELDKDGNWSSG